MLGTIIGWLIIIAATYIGRLYLQHVYDMPSDRDRLRSWRYHRAIRASVRSNQRQLVRARRHEHTPVLFGADSGVLITRCSTCGQTQEE